MAQILTNILEADRFTQLLELENKLEYVSGKATAKGKTKDIKHNLQADPTKPETQEAVQFLGQQLMRSGKFISATQAHKLSAPMFAKYEVGMTYGFHYDMPIMNPGAPLRTDISCTVFLNDDYEGGELEIQVEFGSVKLKGEPGDVLIYPSGSYHRVAPVTDGIRKVAVLWIQSRVQDQAKRALLFDLASAVGILKENGHDDPAFRFVKKSYDNLTRMWSVM